MRQVMRKLCHRPRSAATREVRCGLHGPGAATGLRMCVGSSKVGVDVVPIARNDLIGKTIVALGIIPAPGVKNHDERPGRWLRRHMHEGLLQHAIGGIRDLYLYKAGRPVRCPRVWRKRRFRGACTASPANNQNEEKHKQSRT